MSEHTVVLTLYITGETIRSQRAVGTIKSLCEELFAPNYTLEIIDVLENPKLAEEEKIFATPTLIKKMPPPARRIIGDLSDRERVLNGLGIISQSHSIQKGGTQ